MLHFALLLEYIYQKLELIIGVMLSQRLDIETRRKLQREITDLRNIVTPNMDYLKRWTGKQNMWENNVEAENAF